MKPQQQHRGNIPSKAPGSRLPVWLVSLCMLGMITWSACSNGYHIHNVEHRISSRSSSSSRHSTSRAVSLQQQNNGHYIHSIGHSSISSSSSGKHSSIRAVSLQQQAPAAVPGCDAAQRPPVALLMVILGHENATRHDQYWMAVANRRAYASRHNHPLYLVTDSLGSGEHPAWEKLVALQAVFQHSCAEWVWMQDADAYIMNLDRSILDLAHNPLAHRNPKQICDTPTPDIIAAGACLTRINTGSMLWKNTPWTRQFVADAWHSKFIARPRNWWDQAAVLHMYKVGDSKQHMCIVKGRALNAFPNKTNCHDGGGKFQEGDLLVHFPGGMKAAIANMTSRWLQAVPVLPHSLADATAGPAIFTITRAGGCTASGSTASGSTGSTGVLSGSTAAGRLVHVTMHSNLYAKQSSMPKDFDLCVQQQAQQGSNWGWPVAPPPAEFKAVLQRQMWQQQAQQQMH